MEYQLETRNESSFCDQDRTCTLCLMSYRYINTKMTMS